MWRVKEEGKKEGKKKENKTHDSSHLRRQAPNARLMDIETFPIVAHAIDIDHRHLHARRAPISVHGRMRKPPLNGPVDGRPAHRPPDRLVDQHSPRDRDRLGRFAQDEMSGKERFELERKRMIDEGGRRVRIGGCGAREERGGQEGWEGEMHRLEKMGGVGLERKGKTLDVKNGE